MQLAMGTLYSGCAVQLLLQQCGHSYGCSGNGTSGSRTVQPQFGCTFAAAAAHLLALATAAVAVLDQY